MKRIDFYMMVAVVLLPILLMSQEISKSDRAKSLVTAVNQKDAKMYVTNFDENVKVYMYSEDGNFILKVDGIEALYKNWENHFKKYPKVRNEIQHLAEIDNRLIMHDKVWLTSESKERSIVFKFK